MAAWPARAKTDAEAALKLAKAAIHHVLGAIVDDPAKYYLMGELTGSWEKLTVAASSIWGVSVEEIKKRFAVNAERYQAYCEDQAFRRRLFTYCSENGISVPKE